MELFNSKILRWANALIILLLLCSGTAAQLSIRGVVTDASDGTPLVGANVYIKGTTIGITTNAKGEYNLQVRSSADTVEFTYVGYQSQSIPVGGQSVINVALEPDFETLDEVVIIGYGTVKKNDMTGAVSVVQAEDIKKSNAMSLDRALQGKAAGVQVSQTSGMPGSSVSIRIRGVGSINQDAQPYVVIDGIPVGTGTGALTNLSPEDIESVQVLKDASSTAIYGAEGSNGVILIQTKRGTSGKPKVNLRVTTGFSQLPKRMDIMNSDEYVRYYEKAYAVFNDLHTASPRAFPEAYGDSARIANGSVNTDWQDLISDNQAMSQNYHLGISGGNENSTYMISGNYVDEEGVLVTTFRKLLTLKANSDFKINNKLRIGESLSFNYTKNRTSGESQGNPWLTAAIASPLMPVYNDSALGGFQGPEERLTGPNERTNTYAELILNERGSHGIDFFSSTYLDWEIIKGLNFKTTLGLLYGDGRGTSYSPKYELAQRSNPVSSLNESNNEYSKWVWDQQLTYSNMFGKHNITATFVHSVQDMQGDNIGASTSNLQYDNLRVLSQGDPTSKTASQYKSKDRFESYLGRVMYDYSGKYLMTASLRSDGSSRFGPSNRWGTFPSFSIAWKLNEDLLQGINQINLLKVRLGWGQTGNADIGLYKYDATVSQEAEHVYTLGVDQVQVFGIAPFYRIASPDVKWEASTMTNIGVDLNAFNNRVQFSVEYYYKKQNDLLIQLPLPKISGMSGDADPPWVNLGEIHNRGFEFNLIYKKQEGRLNYNISANFTTIKNVIDYLPAGNVIRDYNCAIVGRSIGALYGYVGERILQESDFVTDANGHAIHDASGKFTPLVPVQEQFTAPGDIKFKDLNRDGTINDLDRTIIGKTIPDFSYGLSMEFYYSNFDLSLFFNGIQNVDLYNQYRSRAGMAAGDVTTKDENKLREVQDFWTPENHTNSQTRIALNDDNINSRISSWWIESGSYFKLRNLQLGYTIPSNITGRLNVESLRIYIGGSNLFTITKYKGYDPEFSSTNPLSTNVDFGTYPVPRNFILGLNLNF
jgi:TonB-linked SusC/RagA family outer membrane protein